MASRQQSLPRPVLDHATAQALADDEHLAHPAVRRVAAAWLAAYEAARARGATDTDARVLGDLAWDSACRWA